MILPNFDSEKPANAWFIYDFNVKGPLNKEKVLAISREVLFCYEERRCLVNKKSYLDCLSNKYIYSSGTMDRYK
jgi:hypothetical protein